MLQCLRESQPDRPLKTDITIIGAGLAGLFLADRLTKSGRHVIVIESGDETQSDDVHPFNTVEMKAALYTGATQGRFRCLGGTSTRWGGALLPYRDSDLAAHPCGWHDGWGAAGRRLAQHLPEIERTFGVEEGVYEATELVAGLMPSFVPRLPKWPRFQKRSTANLFRKKILRDPNLEVWVNATVTHIRAGLDRVRGVTAQSAAGNRLDVESPHVVIAAGAIETTRLLLLFNQSNGGSIFPSSSPLGRGFHDHLSARIGDLQVLNRDALLDLFSFRFARGGMRNLRLELDGKTRARERLPAAFLHVAFSRNEKSGFKALREIYQSLQRRQVPRSSNFTQLMADAPWLAKAIFWRVFRQRVLPPSSSEFELHLVSEQEPVATNTIALSAHKTDAFGQPLASISWAISGDDTAAFYRIAEIAFREWESSELRKLATILRRPRSAVFDELTRDGGIYHPAGTTRIGTDATKGVVDDRLRVHGVPGLRLLSTSVYPSVGGSSPSLALIQLASQMAADLSCGVEAP